ncbi:MAG: MJ0042-type zinc finger domain-containing protein [Sphingomicrobium sp.]
MILTCPNCATQYVVKDGAVPPQGRQVRCANCKHSWHQDPEPGAGLNAPADETDTVAEPDTAKGWDSAAEAETVAEPDSIAEATLIEPRSGPEAEERAYEEAMLEGEPAETLPESGESPSARAEEAANVFAEQRAQKVSADFDTADTMGTSAAPAPDWTAPPEAEPADDEFSPFPTAGENEARRTSPAFVILILIVLAAALAVGIYFIAPPEWKARLGVGTGATSQLALVTTHMDRQQLASGNQLLTVTGRVINPTGSEQDVPPLHAEIRTHTGKIVYSWIIDPPARTLAPGASASFNSAEVNAPAGGDELTITFGEPKA